MESELALDGAAWLKGDLLAGFSDLLDADPAAPDLGRAAATLGSADLMGAPGSAPHVDLSTDQGAHADWLKGLMAGVVAPPQPASELMPQRSEPQPFPGFPAAGLLSASLGSMPVPCATAPMSCSRLAEDPGLTTPSSWESNLSSFSLESSLVDLPAVPEPVEFMPGNLKSENSFACSELDSREAAGKRESAARREPTARREAPAAKEAKGAAAGGRANTPATKASLADRNRERQQRFRQRQKAKIESLEQQVTKLTAQTRSLAAEKEDLSGRAAKLGELLQARDRQVVGLSSQLSALRCGGGGGEPGDAVQLALSYCTPPLVLTKPQMQAMSGADLCKLWKAYVWQMSDILAKGDHDFAGAWTRASERLDALTSELVQLMMHLWDCCPEFARIKATGCLEEGLPAVDCHGRWQSIAASLGLSPEQTQSLLALRTSMRTRLRQIWAARREAHTSMLACLEEDLACSRDQALQHLKVRASKEAMDEGLAQEGLLARDFEFAFYKKVLRPDQRAMCMVRAFPFFPDSQALANWVAANAGDAEAASMMTMHSTSSTTSFHSNS